jgi:beta propeller repeat protein
MSAPISSWTRRAAAALAPAAVVIAVVLMPVFAPPAAGAAPAIFPVCIQAGGQAGPDIAGDLAVWTDNRNGNLDIYGRYLSSTKDFAVCTNPAGQDNPSVTKRVIGGQTHYIVVWVDDRNTSATSGATDIWGRDMSAKTDAFPVSGKNTATIKWYPEISDNWVVWVEATTAAGPYDIMARDLSAPLSKKNPYKIATSKVLSPLGVASRVVAGKTVHTAVYTSASGDISARELPDGTPFAVAQTAKFEWSPDISGDRVVWWETGGRVMVRNLATKKTNFVALGARPRVDGKLVAWDSGGHGGTFTIAYTGNAAIYVRNVAAKNAKTVALARKNQTFLFPALSGNTVVWETGPARRVLSHIHIYGARL